MTIIPAIDILDGHCVRLTEGDYSRSKVYERDPVVMAQRFADAGARRLHVVDLNAARGEKTNRAVIARVRRAVDSTIQLGGGVRTAADVEELLSAGIDRLIVGTVFARDPDSVATWAARFGEVFLAGIDAAKGAVKVAGWEESESWSDIDLARNASTVGVAGIIYTAIHRDGLLGGPDIERTNAVAAASGVPVVLSGGVASAEDLASIRSQSHPNVVGAIVGKAIYEGEIDPDTLFQDRDAAGVDVVEW